MGINLTRLKKLIREANEREREEREESEKFIAKICSAGLAHSPGLRLVKACDTDEETYARIQEVIATSERRTADAKRWRARINDPTHPAHPDHKPWRGGTKEEFRDHFNASMADIPERCRREQDAIAAARKRLGMPPGDADSRSEPGDDPPPGPLE